MRLPRLASQPCAAPLPPKMTRQIIGSTFPRLNLTIGQIFYAVYADPIVRAKLGQRKFAQTLSQTFAQLSIGLAIFDRRRQLATLNPALLDMTNLPFEFLSRRPSIDAMLDRLREFQMLPKPKDYASWRENLRWWSKRQRKGPIARIGIYRTVKPFA